MIRKLFFFSFFLNLCWASNECFKRSSEFVEKDGEVIPDVKVSLYTTPVVNSPVTSKTADVFTHEWSLVFYFPDTGRVMTHEGKLIDDEGISCSQNEAPKEKPGSTTTVLGIVSGSPKMFVEFAVENEKHLSYQSLTKFSQNWAMSMAKSIGGEVWKEMRNLKKLFDETHYHYTKHGRPEINFEDKMSETFSMTKQGDVEFDFEDVKCAAALGVNLAVLWYCPMLHQISKAKTVAQYLGYAGFVGMNMHTYNLCRNTGVKLVAKFKSMND